MDIFGESLSYDIYFFDKVEKDVIDSVYGQILDTSFIHETPIQIALHQFEEFFKTTYLRQVQDDLYKSISGKSNHFVHKYLTISFSQIGEYAPIYRVQKIREVLQNRICSQEGSYRELNEEEKYIFQSIFNVYTKYFSRLVTMITELHTDFKNGLLNNPRGLQEVIPDPINPKTVNYQVFNEYIKKFEYNYPYDITPLNFKYSMRDLLNYLKTEILDNLIILGKDDRKAYLNKLKYQLSNNKQHAYTTQETINEWLNKYKVEAEEIITAAKPTNALFNILTSDSPKFGAEFDENFNRDTREIQRDFYNYYYGFYLDTAIAFIEEQILQHDPTQKLSTISNQSEHQLITNPKLKTNLSVPQLAYLFKMLMDINPPIFDIKTKKELYLFIEANFTTKGKDESGPTVAKLNNLYSDVDKATAIFWAEKLAKMLQEARKV